MDATGRGPHQGQPLRGAGAPLERAGATLIMVHGRGATADSILELADVFAQPDVAYLAPQAAGGTWYPHSFLAPIEQNQPGLDSGLRALQEALDHAGSAGLSPQRTAILGFSQGACLALEFAARRGHTLGGVVGLSGGLIGTSTIAGAHVPDDKAFEYAGRLDGTPVFIGCSDVDPHIPVERVHRSTEVLRGMGAEVTERIYPGMGHTVNDDEIRWVRGLLARLAAEGRYGAA
jgi:predicted esterase